MITISFNYLGTAICNLEGLQIMCGFNSLVFSAGDVEVKCNHHVLNNRAIFMVQVF